MQETGTVKKLNKYKDILIASTCRSKWSNFGQWTKEKYTNLYEACLELGIKVKEGAEKHLVIITHRYGCMEVKCNCTLMDLPRYITIIMAQQYLYLGDKTKFITRFKDYNL